MVAPTQFLGLMLIQDGYITRPQLFEGLRMHQRTGKRIGRCLIDLGYITAEQLLGTLTKQTGIPALPRGALQNASAQAAERVPSDIATHLKVVPFTWDGRTLVFAAPDAGVVQQVAAHPAFASYQLAAYLGLESEIDATLHRLYDSPDTAPQEISDDSDSPPPAEQAPDTHGKDGLYDTFEKLYDADNINDLSKHTCAALGHFFTRIWVGQVVTGNMSVLASAGLSITADGASESNEIPAESLPEGILYGPSQENALISTINTTFTEVPAPIALTGVLKATTGTILMVYADNGDSEDTYNDLQDVESVFKEVESALNLLLN